MKTAFIIEPSKNTAETERCIRSLNRQKDAEIEVVVAENVFDDGFEEFADSLPNVRRISKDSVSREDKLREAAELTLNGDADRVIFVDAGTLAVPTAARNISRAAENADAVCFASFVPENDRSPMNRLGEAEFFVSSGLRGLQGPRNICVPREMLRGFSADPFKFKLFIFDKITGGARLSFCDEPCFYEKKAPRNETPPEEYKKCCEDFIRIMRAAFDGKNSEIISAIIYNYVGEMLYISLSEGCPSALRAELFDCVRELGREAKKNKFADACFSNLVFAPTDMFIETDISAYKAYIAANADISAAKKTGENADGGAAEQDVWAQNDKSPAAFGRNPVIEIPQMFANGQLGMKVILRSINGWLNFKRHRGR